MENNDILKENDIFVSSLLNPQASAADLIKSGVNATNTGFLTPDVYKNSDFVKLRFSDSQGNFDETSFEAAYNNAAKQYDQLTSILTMDDLGKVINKYNPNDLYASPLTNKMDTPSYEIKKINNPMRVSEGVTSLFEKGLSDKSIRELAQQHKIWDSQNQKWLDETADERGVFGSIFGTPLVYATWDEDGEHFDKSIGRTVRHKKGEWKTDDTGSYYTETIGDKEAYGKQFVAASDTLTKEDSWLNKIDFFDSDGLNKSAVGTTFKMLTSIAPYMIPGVNLFYGGAVAATQLATVMPTFAKMMEGIAVGDRETGFTKKMNLLENYWKLFDSSYSDDAQDSNWGYQKMATLVKDIFGQLYQMRAMSSLSNLKKLDMARTNSKAFLTFAEKFGAEYAAAAEAGNVEKGVEGMAKFWKSIANDMPEIKEAIESQSKLAKNLSLGYMALTSSADVYQDAIQGGYDRRMAGLAGIIATAGQYGIMMNNKMGDWFLDATTGYKEGISKNVLKKALRPYYDLIQEGVDKIGKEVTTEGKTKALSNVFNTVYNKGIKGFWNILKDGGEEYWKRAIIEGTEEVTEEAVMDLTKGAFDFMSWMGIGKNSDTATFGGWSNAFSKSGFERYLMNAVGGAVGGALFTFLGNVLEPLVSKSIGEKIDPETKASLIHEIASGHTEELLKAIDEMCTADNKVLAVPVQVDGVNSNISGDGNTTTRGLVISKYLKNYVKLLEGIIQDNGLNLSDTQLFLKVIRDKALLPMIESSEIHKLILTDFNQLASDLALLQLDLEAEESKTETEDKKNPKETKSEDKTESEKIKDLKKQIAEKKKSLSEFLNGEMDEKYLLISLAYLHKGIRESLLNMDKYSYTQSKYNMSYNDLPDSGAGLTKADLDKEYAEWKDQEQPELKFIKIAVPAFNKMELTLSPAIKEYVDNYYKVRANSLKSILSASNGFLGGYVTDLTWRTVLSRLTEKLGEENKVGATLNDIFQVDEDFIKGITDEITRGHNKYFKAAAEALDISEDEAKQIFVNGFMTELEKYPVFNLNKPLIDLMLFLATKGLSGKILQKIKGEENIPLTLESVNLKLEELGFDKIQEGVVNSEQELADAFGMIVSPKINAGTEFGFETTVLMKYLENLDNLDAEIVRTIKNTLYQLIVSKHLAIANALLDYNIFITKEIDGEQVDESGVLSLTENDFKLLDSKILDGLDNNLKIKDIINDWLTNPVDGVITIQHKDDPELQNLLEAESDAVTKILNIVFDEINNTTVQAYEKQIGKNTVKNPLFELLRKTNFEVSKAGKTNLMELLDLESAHLSLLPSVDEYLRLGITAEQIDNFDKLLDLFRAVVLGMEDSPISLGAPISYNGQLKRYKEKWHQGKDADKYQLISTDLVIVLNTEIDLLKNKLKFLKGLIDSNTESKIVENQKTKENFLNLLLQFIRKKGSELKINGISILPPKDEIDKRKDQSEKLGFAEHYIYDSFQKAIEKSNVEDCVKQLLEKFEFNGDEIVRSGLKSNGLNSKTTSISETDLLTYLATIISVDQNEYLGRYKLLLSEEAYSKVPFYAQEYAMKIGYAFYADKQRIHKEIVKLLFKGRRDLAIDETSNILFINGISGAGKTSVVQAGIKYMLNKTETVWIAAPNMNQANKLSDSLSITSKLQYPLFDKRKLLLQFFTEEIIDKLESESLKPTKDGLIKTVKVANGNKYQITPEDSWIKSDIDTLKLPTVIFIDEITHFNKAELMALDFVASKYNIKLCTSGDTLQRGAKIGSVAHNIESIFSWRTPRLLISVRANNTANKDNTDLAKQRLIAMEDLLNEKGLNDDTKLLLDQIVKNSIFEVKYFESDSELHGTKIVQNFTTLDLQKLLAAVRQVNSNLKEGETPKKIGILADLVKNADGEWELKDTEFKRLLQDLGLDEGQYTLYYSPDDFNERAVQGSEEEYFIIKDINVDADADKQTQLTSFYTYITRSMAGCLLKLPADLQRSLNIVNKKVPHTDGYLMPGLDLQTGLKESRIAEIDKIIGENYATSEDFGKSKAEKSEDENKAEEEKVAETPKPQPKTERKNVTPTEEKEIEDLEETGEELALQEKKLNVAPIDQLNIGTSLKPDAVDQGIWGYGFYEHRGIVKKDTHYYATKDGTALNFDGLIPPSEYITFPIRNGFSKFQKVISLYQNTSSLEFKDAMYDPDILDFFYAVDPELAEHHHPNDINERREDVYRHLVSEGELQIDPNDYIFGKYFVQESDRSYHVGRSELEELKDGLLLLLFGHRIIVKNKKGEIKINQYISSGIFANDDYATAAAKRQGWLEYYDKVKEQVKKDLENPGIKLAVLQLPDKKRIQPISHLLVYKMNDDFVETLYTMRNKGVSFDPLEIGKIDNQLDDATGEFKFLEFMARYESNGDETLYRLKLAEFKKAPLQGGFVIKDSKTGNKKLSIAGKYFVPVSFTKANDRSMSRILILEPSRISFNDAAVEVLNIIGNHGGTSKDAIPQLQKMRKLSVYSLTRFIISALKHIGAIDSNGHDTLITKSDGTKLSAVKLYILRTIDQMKKIKTWLNPDISELEDLVNNNDVIDEATLKSALKKTTSAGIFFIDANIRLKSESEGKGLYIYDLASPEVSKPHIDLDFDADDDFGYRNFLIDSTIRIDGVELFSSSLFKLDNVNEYLLELGLVGHQLQMPKYGLTRDLLSTVKSVSSLPLSHVAIDRSVIKHAQEAEDLTGQSWTDLKKNFDESAVKAIPPEIIIDSSVPVRYSITKGHKTVENRSSITNKFGYNIRRGDVVQLYNDEGDNYTVDWVDPNTGKITFSLKNGEDLTTHYKSIDADAVTRVVSRTINSWADYNRYDFYGIENKKHQKVWKIEANKKIKENAKGITVKLETVANKEINYDDFDISKLQNDKNLFIIIPFNETEDYNSESILDTHKWFVILDLDKDSFAKSMKETLDELADTSISAAAGAIILHIVNSESIVSKEGIDAIKNKLSQYFAANGHFIGFTQNVVLFKDYLRPAPNELRFPLSLEAYAEGKGLNNRFEDLTSDLIKLISGESKEELIARGFPAKYFLFLPSHKGTIFSAIPKEFAYTDAGLPIPNVDLENPKLQVDALHPILLTVYKDNGDLDSASPITITEIVTDDKGNKFYKGVGVNGQERTYKVEKIDYRLGFLFFILNEENNEDNEEIKDDTEDTLNNNEEDTLKEKVETSEDEQLTDKEQVVESAKNTVYWPMLKSVLAGDALDIEQVKKIKEFAEFAELDPNSQDLVLLYRLVLGVLQKGGKVSDIIPNIEILNLYLLKQEMDENYPGTEIENNELDKYDTINDIITEYAKTDLIKKLKTVNGNTYELLVEPEDAYELDEETETWAVCSSSLVTVLPF